MRKYALIENGIVTHVVVYPDDPEVLPPEGGILVTEKTGETAVGGEWNGKVFTPLPKRERTSEELIAKLQVCLARTDWMIIRHAETGESVPGDVLVQRQAARDEISKLRDQV